MSEGPRLPDLPDYTDPSRFGEPDGVHCPKCGADTAECGGCKPVRCEGCGAFIAEDADGFGQQETDCGFHCLDCCDCEDGGEWEGLDYGGVDAIEDAGERCPDCEPTPAPGDTRPLALCPDCVSRVADEVRAEESRR